MALLLLALGLSAGGAAAVLCPSANHGGAFIGMASDTSSYPVTPAQDGRDDVAVRLLDTNEAQMRLLAKFDAGKAKCVLPQDRERLLAVIEAGFGSLDAFNRKLRTAVEEAEFQCPEKKKRPQRCKRGIHKGRKK